MSSSGEKPNTNPPNIALATLPVTSKQRRYAVHAVRAGARRERRLNDATGPTIRVIGANTRPGKGMMVVQARL